MNSDLVAFPVHLLHGRVVGVLVGDEVGGFDVAPVGVLALAVEHLLVQLNVVVIDGVVEGDRDHHGHILGRQVSRDRGAVFRAEAVGEHAHGGVARWSPIGVIVDICAYRARGRDGDNPLTPGYG